MIIKQNERYTCINSLSLTYYPSVVKVKKGDKVIITQVGTYFDGEREVTLVFYENKRNGQTYNTSISNFEKKFCHNPRQTIIKGEVYV